MGLFSNDNAKIEKLQRKVKKKLDDRRYRHSIGVCYTAASLAMRYNEDMEDALIAGILHDCAKYMKDEAILKKAVELHVPLTTTEQLNPDLIHAKLGAHLAYSEYKIKDENILNAISFHTTGRPNMSMLEKIIFVSDYIEPMRNKAKELEVIRNEAFTDIDKAVWHITANTLTYLHSHNKVIDEMTIETNKFYSNKK